MDGCYQSDNLCKANDNTLEFLINVFFTDILIKVEYYITFSKYSYYIYILDLLALLNPIHPVGTYLWVFYFQGSPLKLLTDSDIYSI